jgi:hypothetical protein
VAAKYRAKGKSMSTSAGIQFLSQKPWPNAGADGFFGAVPLLAGGAAFCFCFFGSIPSTD